MLRTLFLLVSTCLVVYTSAQEKITVAVAANMQYTIREIITEFNKGNSVKVEVVIGASGHLTRQVMNGAPFDVFISADRAFPQKLSDEKFTIEAPAVYARGILVLWTTRPAVVPSADLKTLLDKKVKRIAIANVSTAPYGTAAEVILKKYGLYNQVAAKLVTGESITQASHFIVTGNADVGFTAKSIVLSDEMKNKGKWVELDSADYPAIEQSVALLKYSASHNAADAKKFYDFLFSAEAKAIYKKSGYIVQ